MSSFVGHSLTAVAVFLARRKPKEDFSWTGLFWLFCLGCAAVAPDLDYFFSFLHKSNYGGIRISNSFAYAMIFPTFVCLGMLLARMPREQFKLRAAQIYIAGLSHILLDYLVGVHPSPLFWPISDLTYVSPIGVLPSAGAISLTNFYFFRNLGIELGVLVPIYLLVFSALWKYPRGASARVAISCLLIAISTVFIVVAVNLGR